MDDRTNLNYQLLALGDTGVGKTSALISFASGSFCGEYVPNSAFDYFEKRITVDNDEVLLGLCDSAGCDDGDRRQRRILKYPQTHCVLIFYSVCDAASFENVKDKWLPEVKQHLPKVPIVLVATKTDLRESSQIETEMRDKWARGPITPREGRDLAQELRVAAFIEISSLREVGLDETFRSAANAVRNAANSRARRKRSSCTIL